MSVKNFNLGGIDLKRNDLIRNPSKASDLRNVTKTQKGDINKRPGYALGELFSGSQELEESLYYKTNDEELFVKSDGTFHKIYAGARQSCTIASLFPNVGVTVKNRIVYTEYLSSLYVTTSDGKSPVVKYDGSDAYLAGLPAPTLLFNGNASTISSAGTTYYYRFFYEFKDLNSNITVGPYVQYTSNVTSATVTVSTFKTANPHGKFFNKYLVTDASVQNLRAAANTLNYSSTNYVVGDKLLLDAEGIYASDINAGTSVSKVLTITAKDATTITFDPAGFGDFDIQLPASTNIDTRTRLVIYISSSESFGYRRASSMYSTKSTKLKLLSPVNVINHSADNFTSTSTSINTSLLLEDYYNVDLSKLRPPLCKYICAYGEQLVFGNIIGSWDQLNTFVQYNNDDIIMWSDLEDNGECMSADYQPIGDSWNGSVTGVQRCNDSLLITKNNALYSIDGIIEAGGFSIRKIPTNYIGCESHNSMLQVVGGVMFHGNDGMYFTNAVSCQEISDDLDPLFNTMLTTRTKSTVNRGNKMFLFYMTDGTIEYVMAYSYESKEWMVWTVLDMSKGIYEKNDGTVKFAKANSLYALENSPTGLFTTYSDAGTLIAAYYSTSWFHLEEPSFDKKYKYIRIWNLSSVATVFTMTVQKDYIDTDLETVTVTIPARSSIQKAFTQRNCKSVRFIFKESSALSGGIGKNMVISAYEVDCELIQYQDKGA